MATAHELNQRNNHDAGRRLTIGISTLIRLGSVPPSVGSFVGLIGILSAFSFPCVSITSLLEELVDLESVRRLLIEVPRFFPLGIAGRKPAT